MRKCLWAIVLILSSFSIQAGESIPAWVEEQLTDRTILHTPGVYPLKDGFLLGVGLGESNSSMRESSSIRHSLQKAERDATYRIARHLYPDDFARHKTVSVDVRHKYRIFELPAQSPRQSSYVAVVVNTEDVFIRPLLDASVIVNANKVILPPEMCFYLQDPLLQLGGGRIAAR